MAPPGAALLLCAGLWLPLCSGLPGVPGVPLPGSAGSVGSVGSVGSAGSAGSVGSAGSPVLPFSAGLLFFPGLFVLGRCVLRRLRCPEPHAEILAARHWLASWYPPFAVPYFIYDVYAMFLCHRHRARVKGHEEAAAPAPLRRAALAFLRRDPLMVLHHAAMVLVCFPVATLQLQHKNIWGVPVSPIPHVPISLSPPTPLYLFPLGHSWVPWGTPGSLTVSGCPNAVWGHSCSPSGVSLGPLMPMSSYPCLPYPHSCVPWGTPGSLGALLGPPRFGGAPMRFGGAAAAPAQEHLGCPCVPMSPYPCVPYPHSCVPWGTPGSLGALLGPSPIFRGTPCVWGRSRSPSGVSLDPLMPMSPYPWVPQPPCT
ncbi:ceramide synthase isoform X2 [Columba livia]|uniref:ceramide synthase isoform X2 n=1 Tax=Columba livia TaxID=8932 RepID=UPI0031BA3AB3